MYPFHVKDFLTKFMLVSALLETKYLTFLMFFLFFFLKEIPTQYNISFKGFKPMAGF